MQHKSACPFDFIREHDEWFRWHVDVYYYKYTEEEATRLAKSRIESRKWAYISSLLLKLKTDPKRIHGSMSYADCANFVTMKLFQCKQRE